MTTPDQLHQVALMAAKEWASSHPNLTAEQFGQRCMAAYVASIEHYQTIAKVQVSTVAGDAPRKASEPVSSSPNFTGHYHP